MKYINKRIFELTRFDKWVEEHGKEKFFNIDPPKSYDRGDIRDVLNSFAKGYNNSWYDYIQEMIKKYPILKKSFIIHKDEWRKKGNTLIELVEDRFTQFSDYDAFYNDNIKRLKDVYEYELNEEVLDEIKTNWESISKVVKSLKKKKEYYTNVALMRAKKFAKRKQINFSDLTALLAWISHFRSKSYRKIPKDIWDALHYITVDPNELPKTVYRGLFYDGDKIKDKEAFLKKWAKGSKPGVNSRKASSWTSNIEVAKNFMISQDQVKDHKNGYHVLLKYDIQSPKDVIADFRYFDWMAFWNQQEVLLSPDAKDYEVVEIFPYTSYDEKDKPYHKYLKSGIKKSFSGSMGHTFKELIRMVFDVGLADLPQHQKDLLLKHKDLTLGDIDNNLMEEYKYLEALNIPFYYIMERSFNLRDINIIDDKTIENVSYIYVPRIGDSYNKDYVWDKTNKLITDNSKINKDNIYDLIGYNNGVMIENIKAKMIRNDALSFVVKIDLSKADVRIIAENKEIENKLTPIMKENKQMIFDEFIKKLNDGNWYRLVKFIK